jgi:hypothetical protein
MALGMLTAGVLAGCAGAPRVTAGRAVVVAAKRFQIVPPAGWEPVPSDADLALRQPALQAGLMAHGTCEGKTPRRPLPVLARHLRFGLRDVRDLDQAPVEVAGQRGVRSRFTARLDGVPVAVGTVTVEGDGCVYDLVVVAPPERFLDAAEAFERFAGSFAVIGPPAR